MASYAIFKTGGKQYRAAPGQQLTIEKVADADGNAVARGAEVVFDHVLLIGGDAGVQVGTPLLAGAKVHAQVVEQTRDNKVLIHKYRRRKNSRKTMGHRQSITRVRITQIEA